MICLYIFSCLPSCSIILLKQLNLIWAGKNLLGGRGGLSRGGGGGGQGVKAGGCQEGEEEGGRG